MTTCHRSVSPPLSLSPPGCWAYIATTQSPVGSWKPQHGPAHRKATLTSPRPGAFKVPPVRLQGRIHFSRMHPPPKGVSLAQCNAAYITTHSAAHTRIEAKADDPLPGLDQVVPCYGLLGSGTVPQGYTRSSRDGLGLDSRLRRRISIASALFVRLHTVSSLCTTSKPHNILHLASPSNHSRSSINEPRIWIFALPCTFGIQLFRPTCSSCTEYCRSRVSLTSTSSLFVPAQLQGRPGPPQKPT